MSSLDRPCRCSETSLRCAVTAGPAGQVHCKFAFSSLSMRQISGGTSCRKGGRYLSYRRKSIGDEPPEGPFQRRYADHVLLSTFEADSRCEEGDIDLLANDEHWDIHAIAGLLKWYFRDLPVSVLDDQQTAFVQTMGKSPYKVDWIERSLTRNPADLVDDRQRIQELARLVSRLPLANYSLLRALCSHLILIIQHSDENKMTLKNVSIILAPTIGKDLVTMR